MKKSKFLNFIINPEGFQKALKRALFSGFGACFELQVTLKIFLEVLGPQPRYLKYPSSVDLHDDIKIIVIRHIEMNV